VYLLIDPESEPFRVSGGYQVFIGSGA